jgi:hypothetical protein
MTSKAGMESLKSAMADALGEAAQQKTAAAEKQQQELTTMIAVASRALAEIASFMKHEIAIGVEVQGKLYGVTVTQIAKQ